MLTARKRILEGVRILKQITRREDRFSLDHVVVSRVSQGANKMSARGDKNAARSCVKPRRIDGKETA